MATDEARGFKGVTVAVPESRQLDIMVRLLENRGARVFRAPLVAIHDAPDSRPVLDWLGRFIAQPPDLFIILTGEGIRRLVGLAGRHGLERDLVQALATTTKLARGPKPDRALREIGLRSDIPAQAPTTDGVIASLADMNLKGQRIAVQLYGDDPNIKLMSYLEERGGLADPVAPYVYADAAEAAQVVKLIDAMANGEVEAIAFTSQPQYRRLAQVAGESGIGDRLAQGLARCCVAAVGPVVAAQLREAGIRVDLVPEQAFFMKPLVSGLQRWFAARDA